MTRIGLLLMRGRPPRHSRGVPGTPWWPRPRDWLWLRRILNSGFFEHGQHHRFGLDAIRPRIWKIKILFTSYVIQLYKNTMERWTSVKKFKIIHTLIIKKSFIPLLYNDSKMHSHNPDVRTRFLDRMRSPGKKIKNYHYVYSEQYTLIQTCRLFHYS